jgi:hypothetical protein
MRDDGGGLSQDIGAVEGFRRNRGDALSTQVK